MNGAESAMSKWTGPRVKQGRGVGQRIGVFGVVVLVLGGWAGLALGQEKEMEPFLELDQGVADAVIAAYGARFEDELADVLYFAAILQTKDASGEIGESVLVATNQPNNVSEDLRDIYVQTETLDPTMILPGIFAKRKLEDWHIVILGIGSPGGAQNCPIIGGRKVCSQTSD